MDIQALIAAQRAYFNTGATLSLSARRTALRGLRKPPIKMQTGSSEPPAEVPPRGTQQTALSSSLQILL